MVIYKITNLIDGKTYIGQTINCPRQRWQMHCTPKMDTLLARAIKKHGKSNFKQEIIFTCESLEDLNKAEERLIQEHNSMFPNGYNVEFGGNNFLKSEIHKRKISLALKGRPKSEELKKLWSLQKKGKRQPNNRWVYGFNFKTNEGIFISSACEAVKLGFNQGHLRECCIGQRKSHRGFKWTYLNDILLKDIDSEIIHGNS